MVGNEWVAVGNTVVVEHSVSWHLVTGQYKEEEVKCNTSSKSEWSRNDRIEEKGGKGTFRLTSSFRWQYLIQEKKSHSNGGHQRQIEDSSGAQVWETSF